MIGRREGGQGQFFYAFDLDRAAPPDHLVRQIGGVLDLDWVHKELAPYYSHPGRPSIDPVLMNRIGRPGKGNDKVKVEGMVGYAGRNFLVPIPILWNAAAVEWLTVCVAMTRRSASG